MLVSVFLSYAALWVIFEPLIGMVNTVNQFFLNTYYDYIIFLLLSVFIGLFRVALPTKIKLNIGNNKVEILYDDLFLSDGIKVIPVSRFIFETQVVKTSIQGQLIDRYIRKFGGENGLLEYKRRLSDSLSDQAYESISRGNSQPEEKYFSLGTTSVIDLSDEKFLLCSITKTEVSEFISDNNCTVTNLWLALEKLWGDAKSYSNGGSINIPLLGGGITGINLEPNKLLELNLLAIQNAMLKYGKITTANIRIVLHHSYIYDIQLRDIKRLWNKPS